MNAAWWMLGALAVLSIGYRYYSAFIAAKVLVLDATRVTPAHTKRDGENFHPTNRYVLFGHHFAAISGAGPLIGPVLAAQFGFLPGYIWILFGVVLGGAVHDFVILVASVRRGGRSLAEMARDELGPKLGLLVAVSILAIVVIALAGLGNVVVGALAESAWGTFTIAASIPIALLMGVYLHVLRGGSERGIQESSVFGVGLLLLSLFVGKLVADSSYAGLFKLDKTTLTLAIAVYGFFASVLPVWLLLAPRDYLSSYLKIGTIAALVGGLLIAHPVLEMPPLTPAIHGGGPILKGPLFPFVFITIACGAISGFHALVASGTTPKMLDKETDARAIGYGAMLMEGLVGITALLAACVLPPLDYVAINTDPKIAIVATADGANGHGLAHSEAELGQALAKASPHDRTLLGLHDGALPVTVANARVPASKVLALSSTLLAELGYHVDPKDARASSLDDSDFVRLGIHVTELPSLSRQAGEVVAARTGGGVSLAVGMARVFSGVPGMKALLAYWYHFAIMFEALFILTTIDAGTRIGRFLLQELVGRVSPKFGASNSRIGGVLATLFVVLGWTYFILTGTIGTLWTIFGVANQLLACTALSIATTILLREAPKRKYALITALPLAFVGTTTVWAGVMSVRDVFLPMLANPETATIGRVDAGATTFLLLCLTTVVMASARQWRRLLSSPPRAASLG